MSNRLVLGELGKCGCSGLIQGPRAQRQRAVGKGRYPIGWKGIANGVKSKAGWRCECCGHPSETPRLRATCDETCTHPDDGRQRVLTVHHLDMRPERCDSWNLVALCQSCHLRVQVRVDWRQGWLADVDVGGSEWRERLPEWLAWRRREFLAAFAGTS